MRAPGAHVEIQRERGLLAVQILPPDQSVGKGSSAERKEKGKVVFPTNATDRPSVTCGVRLRGNFLRVFQGRQVRSVPIHEMSGTRTVSAS